MKIILNKMNLFKLFFLNNLHLGVSFIKLEIEIYISKINY